MFEFVGIFNCVIAEIGEDAIYDSLNRFDIFVRSTDDEDGGKVLVLIHPASPKIFEVVFNDFGVKTADLAIAEINELDLLAGG